MSGLGFSQGGGSFLPYVTYNAKAGKFFIKKDGLETEVVNPTFVPSLDRIRTGWMYFLAGSAPQFVWHPSLTQKVARPEGVDKEGKPLFKEGFKVELFSTNSFGGVVEFSSSSQIVREALNAIYIAYEEGKATNQGKLPVVETTGVTAVKSKHGTNFAPNFKIVKWIETPKEFSMAQSQPANQSSVPATPTPQAAQKVVSEF